MINSIDIDKIDKVTVLGAGVTGIALTEYLLGKTKKVFLSEKSSRIYEKIKDYGKHFEYETGGHSGKCLETDIIIPSPGIEPSEDILIKAKTRGITVLSELEFAYLLYINENKEKRKNIIAVTGTNGKTSTVSMIQSIFENNSIESNLCGNIGDPFINNIEKQGIINIEVSSFGLHYCNKFNPHIAVLLNISEDHIKWHKSFKNYVEDKKKIYLNHEPDDIFVTDYDDKLCRELSIESKSKKIYFSTDNEAVFENGLKLIDNRIIIIENYKTKEEIKININNIKGIFLKNALAALICAKENNIVISDALKALEDFSIGEHRMELVEGLNGIKFINDSKSTNPLSVISAVENIKEDFVLIMGGYDKGLNYSEVFQKIRKSRCRFIFFTGPLGIRLRDEYKNDFKDTSMYIENLDDIIRESVSKISQGYILFSPGTSSFDLYKNYIDRGNNFKKKVSEWRQNAKI